MQTPFETARSVGATAVFLLVCLGLTAGSPAVRADYDAGKRALEAGQPDQAAAHWRAAAKSGDGRAMLGLGRLFARGSGIAQDYVEAHKWFNLAASRGEIKAAKERDALSAKMTPEQVAKAQERAKSWQNRRTGKSGTTAGPRPDSGTSASSTSKPQVLAPAEIEAALGLKPADRRLIQAGLAGLGFKPGPADGVFGDRTRAALKAWQAKTGEAATGHLTLAAASTLKAAGEKAAAAERKRRETAMKPGRTFRDCADCPEMVAVPAGSFTMGSPAGERYRQKDEGPQRTVTIARPFAVGKFEVTFAEWDACVSAGGCRHRPGDRDWGRGRRPVINVSWEDAKQYVRWLSRRTGKRYRLLSEAEWEYAARAGTRTAYSWGDSIGRNRANCASCGSRWDAKKTSPVGSFGANRFGLHDLHGNVWEWVEDCWHDNYRGAPTDGRAWTTGDCGRRVLRGGSWGFGPRALRAALRYRNSAGFRIDLNGFRVAPTLAP